MKSIIVHRPKKEPKADKDQRRHLAARIDTHHDNLARCLRRQQGAKMEPPEVAAARKIVEDYEDEVCRMEKIESDKLTVLRLWLREQVLFAPCEQALAFVKRFEICNLDDAMNLGSSMEDRNDVPIGFISSGPH